MKKKWERCVHNNQGNSIFHASGSILPCINEMKNNRAKPNEFREKTSMFSYFVLLSIFPRFFYILGLIFNLILLLFFSQSCQTKIYYGSRSYFYFSFFVCVCVCVCVYQ